MADIGDADLVGIARQPQCRRHDARPVRGHQPRTVLHHFLGFGGAGVDAIEGGGPRRRALSQAASAVSMVPERPASFAISSSFRARITPRCRHHPLRCSQNVARICRRRHRMAGARKRGQIRRRPWTPPEDSKAEVARSARGRKDQPLRGHHHPAAVLLADAHAAEPGTTSPWSTSISPMRPSITAVPRCTSRRTHPSTEPGRAGWPAPATGCGVIEPVASPALESLERLGELGDRLRLRDRCDRRARSW